MSEAGMRKDLERLAAIHGIEPRYRSAEGREVHATDEALLRVLRGMGVPIDDLEGIPEALREARSRLAERRLPRVAVVWEATPWEVALRVSGDRPPEGRVRCRMETEDGRRLEWNVHCDRLPAAMEHTREGGSGGVVRLPLPDETPWGVHRLTVTGPGPEEDEGWVILAPERVHQGEAGKERDWGLFLPLYALRTKQDWGVGDLTGLERFRDWAASRGARWVATLPLLASYLDRPLEPSPYSPVSRLFWNELYLDPSRAPDLAWSPEARELLGSADFREETAAARRGDAVDYRRAYLLKRRVLEPLARAAFGHADRAAELSRFGKARPELVRYARFRGCMERHGLDWWASSRGSRADARPLEQPLDEAAGFHLYVQWLLERQLEDTDPDEAGPARAELYLDLPLGCHPLGYDPWRWPSLFAEGMAVGAPPDALAREGQNWGFPPLQPEASRLEGHRYWRAALRTLLRPSGALRVDHVMALHRLFWIPDGMEAAEGVYVRSPAEELYALLALESRRHECRVVGEDLGTVPEEVRDTMDRHGLLRMYVLPFELEEEGGGPRPVPASAQASLNTHDTFTFSAFVRAADVRRREAAGLLDPESAREELERRRAAISKLGDWLAARGYPPRKHPPRGHPPPPGEAGREAARKPLETDGEEPGALLRACLHFLASSPAELLLVNLEDLWLEERPQNVPGIGSEEGGSWRRRAKHDLDELDGLADVVEALAELRHMRPRRDR